MCQYFSYRYNVTEIQGYFAVAVLDITNCDTYNFVVNNQYFIL